MGRYPSVATVVAASFVVATLCHCQRNTPPVVAAGEEPPRATPPPDGGGGTEEHIKASMEANKLYQLAREQEGADSAEVAARSYTKAIMLEPTLLDAYVRLGTLYADHEFFDQSAQVFEQGLRVAQKCSDHETNLRHRLGTVRMEQRRMEDAATLFEQALACNPSRPDTLFSAGWTRALTGDRERAREHLRNFVKLAAGDDSVRPDYVRAAQYKLDELDGE